MQQKKSDDRTPEEKEQDALAIEKALTNEYTLEEYKHVAGIIRGLALATDILDDLVQRLEKSND